MSETRNLSALAEKVEGLDGPCRETDARVAVACGDIRMSNRSGSIAFFQEPVKKGDYAFLSGCVDGEDAAFRSLGSCLGVKPYTASLDAVVALIEKELPGWYFEVSGGSPESCAAIMLSPDRIKFADHCWDAATPALALLTVFLRTRAAFLRAKGASNG